MPLNTEILREGKALKVVWSEFTLNVFLTAALHEGDPGLHYTNDATFGDLPKGKYVNVAYSGVYYIDTKAPLWREGQQTLKEDFKVGDLELKAGDVLKMWRT